MSTMVIMAGLFALAFVRALYMRQQALVSTPFESCNSIGGWYVLAPILLLPIFMEEAQAVQAILVDNPYLILLGLLKGAGFWGLIYCGQIIRRTSNSSAGFFGFLCIGVIAAGNAIFGEELTLPQWFSVSALFAIGLYFYFKGHLSTQTPFVKLLFLIQVCIGSMFGLVDHFFLTHCHWYGLVFLSGVGMLTTACLFGRRSSFQVFMAPFKWNTAGLGVFQTATEMVILSLFVTYIPVTLGWVAMTLAAVAVMVVAAVYWGEGRWQQQLAVGGTSYAAVLPIVLS